MKDKSRAQGPAPSESARRHSTQAHPDSKPEVRQNEPGALFDVSVTTGAYGTSTVAYTASDGERRRDDGHRRVLDQHRDGWERDAIEKALTAAIASGAMFSSDDLHSRYGVPTTVNPGLLGAAMRAAAKAGRIRKVGFEASKRPGRHAGGQYIWAATK